MNSSPKVERQDQHGPRGRLAAALAMVWLLAACVAQPPLELQAGSPGLPARVELSEVPFFAQAEYQCGPAALAMAMAHSGLAVRPEDLVAEVYSPAKQGSLSVSMIAGARRRGRLAYPISTLDGLFREVAAGNPAIVLQQLGLPLFERWHFAVVIGYDLQRGQAILRSGTEKRVTMPLTEFARSWVPGNNWALLVLAPSRRPVTAQEKPFLSAVVGLERSRQFRAATIGYKTALAQWPNSHGAMIGLGNSYYAADELAEAEAAFREATLAHPTSAAAYNNLAHVLAKDGHLREALTAARRAVSLGGPLTAVSKATLAEISQGLPPQ